MDMNEFESALKAQTVKGAIEQRMEHFATALLRTGSQADLSKLLPEYFALGKHKREALPAWLARRSGGVSDLKLSEKIGFLENLASMPRAAIPFFEKGIKKTEFFQRCRLGESIGSVTDWLAGAADKDFEKIRLEAIERRVKGERKLRKQIEKSAAAKKKQKKRTFGRPEKRRKRPRRW